jgi:hypothetical protein
MTGAAVLAVIALVGIVTTVLATAFISWAIHRDDRRALLGMPAASGRVSSFARHATGTHRTGAQRISA